MRQASTISDEDVEKIVAFVDREAGRDAPLDPDDEAMVRRMIADDPTVRALVDEVRSTNAGLDTLLDDVASVEVPERLVALIQGHVSSDVAIAAHASGGQRQAADSETADQRDVVAFELPARRISYGPLAAAASIALLISSGALYFVYDAANAEHERMQAALTIAIEEADSRGRALADAEAELQRLADLSEQASSDLRESADRLLANEETILRLEVERAALEGRYAALKSDNKRLNTSLEQKRTEIAESEAARERLSTDLAEATQALAAAETAADYMRAALTADIQDLTTRLDQREQEVALLSEELEAGQARSATAAADFARMRDERAALERRLASADADLERLQAERQATELATAGAEQRQASLRAEVEDAESRLATIVAGLQSAEAGRREAVQQVFGLEAELVASKSWLGQIAQYHRVYASTARRHLVEVEADELDHIQEWLTTMLGREILAPDLTDFGVTFAGARLLAINDQPVAQLVYLDADDQPLALCIIPSTREAKDPTFSTNGELNLVDWRDGAYGYAVVGWSDPELLGSLTQAVQPVYEL